MRLRKDILETKLGEVLILTIVNIVSLDVFLDVCVTIVHRTDLQVVDVHEQTSVLELFSLREQRMSVEIHCAVHGCYFSNAELELLVTQEGSVNPQSTLLIDDPVNEKVLESYKKAIQGKFS